MKSKLEALGLAVPKPVVAVEEARKAMRQAVTVTPANDLAESILSGKVDARNASKLLAETARRQVEVESAQALVHRLEPTFDKAYRKAVRENGNEILLTLRGPFDQAVGELREAATVIGWKPSDRQIVTLGAVALSAWEARKQAIKTLAAVRSIRIELGAAGYGPKNQAPAWFVAGADDEDQLTEAGRVWGGGLHNLAASFELRLNTLEEIEAILAGAKSATEKARTAKDAERRRLFATKDRKVLAQHLQFLEEVKP